MEYFIYPKDITFIIKDSLHTRLPHPFKQVDIFHVNKHSYTSVCIFLTDSKMKVTLLYLESSFYCSIHFWKFNLAIKGVAYVTFFIKRYKIDIWVQNSLSLQNLHNVSFTNGSMLCIYQIDNWLWWLFCINNKVFFIMVKKRINENTRYNGGFDDFRVVLIIAFVLATITLLTFLMG